MIYIAAYLGLLGLRLVDARSLYPVALVALFLFAAFRFEVGCDWSGYLNQYWVYADRPWAEALAERESLWALLFVLQGELGLVYPWINVASSALFFAGMHALARRQPDPLAFLVLLFPILIVNMPMSGIRQGAAIGVLGFALVALLDGRLWRYVLLVLVAGAIHASAVGFLLLAPFVVDRYSWRNLAVAGILALPGMAALLRTDSAAVAIDRYVDSGVDAFGAAFRAALLFVTAAFYFLVLRRRWADRFPDDFKLVEIGAILMLLPLCVVPLSSVIADRVGYYLIPVQAVIFARLPLLPGSYGRLVVWAPYVGLLVVFAVWVARSDLFALCYLPYRTWLFGLPEDAWFLPN